MWQVVEDKRQVSTHKTQKAAREAGIKLAKKEKCEFSLQGRDGKIREKNSYGGDPKGVKG